MAQSHCNNINFFVALRLVHSGREKDKEKGISQRSAMGITIDAAAELLLDIYKRRSAWLFQIGRALDDG